MAGNTNRLNELLSRLPRKIYNSLMPFQKEGVKFAVNKNGRCLIADEMGLGKTIQAISVAYLFKNEWPLLIIVPSSLRYSWVEEIEKWLPEVNPDEINMIQSGVDTSGIANAKITITTFGLVCKSSSKVLLELLTKQHFKVIIVDESHTIRNSKTASSKAVVSLVKIAWRKILLSGTPSLSKPVELFPQIDAICPGKFGTWWEFTSRYCDARTEKFGNISRRRVDGSSNLEELQKKLTDMLMIRRLKSDVLTELPPKQRQKILFQLKDSEMKKEIKELFLELKSLLSACKNTEVNPLLQLLQDEGINPLNATNGLIQKLYKLSGDAKIGPVKEYVEMLCENKDLKFLVFAYHHNMMNGIQQSLYNKNIKFVRIDGETPPSERLMLVQQFQSDPDTKVAVLSILAAGVGLTFTMATLVVFAEMYWTPGVMIQCEDRAHRIGQTSCVSVHYLIAKDTMDEWVWTAVCKKTVVTTTTLNGKKQILESVKGDKEHVDVLSNAEAIAPSQNQDVDISLMFTTQQPSNQKTILDYLGSNRKRKLEQTEKAEISSKKSKNLDNEVVCISDFENEESLPVKNLDSAPLSGKMKTMPLFFDNEDDFIDNDKQKDMDMSNNHCIRRNYKKEWNCSACTFLNHAELPFCEMCNSPLKSPKWRNKEKDAVSFTDKNTRKSHSSGDLMTKKTKIPCVLEKTLGVNSCDSGKMVNKTFLDCFHKDKSETENSAISPFKSKNGQTYNFEFCSLPSTSISSNRELSSGKKSEKNCFSQTESISDQHKTEENCNDNINVTNTRTIPDDGTQNSNSILKPESEKMKYSCTDDDDSFQVPRNIEKISDDEIPGMNNSNNTNIMCQYLSQGDDESTLSDSDEKDTLDQENLDSTADFDLGLDLTVELSEEEDTEEIFGEIERCSEKSCLQSQDMEGKDDSQKNNQVDTSGTRKSRTIDLDEIKIHSHFLYQCSKYTGRVYLYDYQTQEPLAVNFLPLDVDMDNVDNLPDLLLHPCNLKIVLKFIREWNSLTDTKKRVLMKSGQKFLSPLRTYEELRSCKSVCQQRYVTKEDTAMKSSNVAENLNGTTRIVRKPNAASLLMTKSSSGTLQALDNQGRPLCIACSKPCENVLIDESRLSNETYSWNTRFCSSDCMDTYWMQTNGSYIRDKVYEVEQGKCQLCDFQAHAFYKQIRDTVDLQERFELLNKSVFVSLKTKQKESMIRQPTPGQFWHVDHIKPVWEGGGQCDVDNLRTLCVICHQKITAEQAKKRTFLKHVGFDGKQRDISSFFQPIK